jgi:hypothetical protein
VIIKSPVLRSRRQKRRLELRRIIAPDAKPDETGWPYGTPPVFQPSIVDEDAERDRVRDQVHNALLGIDEATITVQDPPIDTWAEQWVDRVNKEYKEFRDEVRRQEGLAEAALAELELRHAVNRRQESELDVARWTAFDALTNPLPMASGRPVPSKAEQDQVTAEPVTEPIQVRQVQSSGHVRKPKPDPGFRAPSMIAGRPVGVFVHVVALVLAALADIGAFWQVVQLVMTRQPAWVAFVVVLGMTACVLYLAHSIGVQARDKVARSGPARWTWIALGFLGWVALGAVAFWVRMTITDEQTREISISLTPGAAQPATEDTGTALIAAILFAALYVGSGLVAAIGAYVTHNPGSGSYRKAMRGHAAAAELAAVTAGAVTAVRKRLRHLRKALRKAKKLREYETNRRLHFAEELKAHAKNLMVAYMKDPAFTDAVLGADRVPRTPFSTKNGATPTNGAVPTNHGQGEGGR